MGLIRDLYGNVIFPSGTHLDSGPEDGAQHSSTAVPTIIPGHHGGHRAELDIPRTDVDRDNRAIKDSHGNVAGYFVGATSGISSEWSAGKENYKPVSGICRLLADAVGVYLADADGKLLLA